MSDDLTLRPATSADLAAVDALLAHSYPRLLAKDYPPSIMVMALPLIARARPVLLASGTYWLALDAGGALAGAGGWTPDAPGPVTDPAAGRTGHVRHLVTAAGWLRRGVARALMGRAMAQARAAGMDRMECLSTRTAVPFYTALGFHALGPVDVPLQPGIVFPAVAMQRAL